MEVRSLLEPHGVQLRGFSGGERNVWKSIVRALGNQLETRNLKNPTIFSGTLFLVNAFLKFLFPRMKPRGALLGSGTLPVNLGDDPLNCDLLSSALD